jgi:branched-chain amino acid aminotransferase
MYGLVSQNGKLLGAADNGDLLSGALMYGRGVFTTVAIYNGIPFLWDKHWGRLSIHARSAGVSLADHGEASTRSALEELLAADHIVDGRARITFFDESPAQAWGGDSEQKTSLLITTGEFRRVPTNFRLTLSPYIVNSRSPLAGIKSCNYLENLLAYEKAAQGGFDEAVRLNDRGEITSACMANIFWINDRQIFTPPLSTGCLAGTTREVVVENSDVREAVCGAEALIDAEAIFLTSAGIGIAVVSMFEGRELGPVPKNITDLIPQKNTKPREP